MNPLHVSLEEREAPSHIPMFENGIQISASFLSMPQSKLFELQMTSKKNSGSAARVNPGALNLTISTPPWNTPRAS